uniref:CDP-diacylglycerol--inositol 3-phosphatidyltransferase n=1 Tax=Astatotilapia calliptera TaxID=8154 RepID=A0A3P8Q7P0_ASTCA
METENIFLFVPNLIGYARVVLALISFFLMPCCPWPAVFCYLLSALLDAFDGHAARALNQSTKFGAMLDMLTDRCATMCLLVNLSLLYPSYAFLFQLSMCLDIASHWLHLHSSTVKGSASHKTIDLSGNAILRLYYTSKVCVSYDKRVRVNFKGTVSERLCVCVCVLQPVLFVMCAGNELFFCLLYLLYHIEEPAGWLYWLQGLCGIICLLKSGISVLHLITASKNMAAIDAAEREKALKMK